MFRFESNLRYTDQLQVRLISDQVLSHVEFRSSRDSKAKNLLSKLNFRLSSLKVDHKVSQTDRDLPKSRVCYYDNSYGTALFAAVDRRLERPRYQVPLLLGHRSSSRTLGTRLIIAYLSFPRALKNAVQNYFYMKAFITSKI